MRRAVAVLTTAVLLLLSALGGANASTFTQRLYLRNDGGANCPGYPYLSVASGTDEPGCGYPAGAPVGEIHGLTGGTASNVRVYDTIGGITPKVLDALRNVSGNIRVFSWSQSNRIGAGTVRVDVTVAGRRADSSTVTLGEWSGQQVVDPTTAEMDFPFSFAVPDELDHTQLADISITVDIRGVHVMTGYQRLNGQSWLDVPIHSAPDVPAPPPAPAPAPAPSPSSAPSPSPEPAPEPSPTASPAPTS